MASYRKHLKVKPWMARRRRDDVEYVIGFFATKTEAEEAERGFDNVWPRTTSRGKRRQYSSTGRYFFA